MSVSNLEIFVKCRHCGRPMRIKQARSYRPDADMALVQMTQRVAMENALCADCTRAMEYYNQQGRLADWENGNA